MSKSIGTLFKQNRLLAKTINRIIVEPDRVELTDWTSEAKLLCSPGGSSLSSATLLVKGRHVPTYGHGGRCYGFLFNAESAYIYDVSSSDSNSNRTTKLQYRQQRKNIDLLESNPQGIKTLDDLSAEIMVSDGVMNEILLDVWKVSCVGLFVRKIDLDKATPDTLKFYYQSLLEIKLVHKLYCQRFGFSEEFQIYQYDEKRGALLTFPNTQELLLYARMQGVHEKRFPELFRLLADDFHFRPLELAKTVEEFLKDFPKKEIKLFRHAIISKLLETFEPFDGRELNEESILREAVDPVIGVSSEMITEIITRCEKEHHNQKSEKQCIRQRFFSDDITIKESNHAPSQRRLSYTSKLQIR